MDMRSFIDCLQKRGQLRRIDRQVDWKYELGAMTREAQVPLLFENIKDYPGHQVFTNGLIHLSSIALALGMESGTSRKDLVKELRRRITTPVPPARVTNGPVLENIVEELQLDLLKFPVPHWNKSDAGRYIGTWHVNISRDPEDRSYNLGVYRMQVLGPRQATISTSSKSHLGIHFAKSEAMGKPLETAVAIGVSEAVFMAAGAGYPCGKDEYELAGALQGKSVNLVKCEDVDLEAPADTEILIEGHIKPRVRVLDGPYFDYAGKATTNPKAFLFEATRMMFRSKPIFRGAVVGYPGAEDIQLFSALSEVGLFDFHGSRLRRGLQIFFLKEGFFRAFQFAGRIGPGMLTIGSGRGKAGSKNEEAGSTRQAG